MCEILLIFHFIGLAVGLGTSFAFMFLGFSAAKMDMNEAMSFTPKTYILGRMGQVGLTLLVISGLFPRLILTGRIALVTSLTIVVPAVMNFK